MVENAHACWQKLVMNNKQELSEKMGFEIIGGFTLFIVPALLVREGYVNSACKSLGRCSPLCLTMSLLFSFTHPRFLIS